MDYHLTGRGPRRTLSNTQLFNPARRRGRGGHQARGQGVRRGPEYFENDSEFPRHMEANLDNFNGLNRVTHHRAQSIKPSGLQNQYGGLRKQNTSRPQQPQRNAYQREEARDSRNPDKKERPFDRPVFGFKKLYKLSTMNPDEVVLSINKDKDDWIKFLESDDLNSDRLILAIEVIGEKVCADIPVLKQQQINVITEVCASKKFMANILQTISNPRTAIPASRNCHLEFQVNSTPMKVMGNVYQICDFVVKTMPHLALDSLSGVLTMSVGALYGMSGNLAPQMIEKFKVLQEHIQEFNQKQKEKEDTHKRRRHYGFNEMDMTEFDKETPPDDYREIEIIPKTEELLLAYEPFLRPNKKTGAYVDSDHYLDVQFRLLREDFVRPLRQGIRTFMADSHKYINGARMPLGEVRLYTEVRVTKVIKERDSIVYKIQLSESSFKRIKWEKSKRLLPGSLVIFTTPKRPFETAHFGVIFNRNFKELKNGILTVTWEGPPPPSSVDGEEYLMFESEVYLEAYRHTLEALKGIELDSYAMKKFIVDACSAVDAPNYLKNAKMLLKVQLANGFDRYIAPLRDDNWPSAEQFGLDENQFRAFKAAITNEFSIIQGPPGTGKTFLGLKVAQVLLSNSGLWKGSSGDDANPITVVCYTNHALDQFMEGILRYFEKEKETPDIIRIGGRCQSESLANFTLMEVRKRCKRKLPKHYWAMEHDAKDKVARLEQQRTDGMGEVIGLLHAEGIINFETLSTWSTIKMTYPRTLWKNFQDLHWFGLDKYNLGTKILSEAKIGGMIRKIFDVTQFPKTALPRQENKQTQPTKANRIVALQDEEDDEDYDLNELLENRLVDDILLESETTSRKETTGRQIHYLPNCSSQLCFKSITKLQTEMEQAVKAMTPDQANIFWNSKSVEIIELENRANFMAEIFRLYKEQLINLPDILDLLDDIQNNRIVHYNHIPMDQRWALYFEVVTRLRLLLASGVADIENNLIAAQKAKRDVMDYGDGLILKDCKVVGLTTTGAAKYNGLLKMMGSKIVIVEEAAEVFEAHIVTCVTKKCEQLILIGDHRQLRPSPTVYDLATKYNLDLSLFERMINNNLHCHSLKMQHRMRPEISDLVVGSIYPELLNHHSVKIYPDIKGVTKNVFFLSHTEKETSDTDSCSKSNIYEAKFISGLCRYLVLQDYKPEQITVLTMYTGQMFLLKKEIAKTCEGVRITCVDNYQGEENDIILLSLVRSNSEGQIGFLNVDNRICVSLSRAKQGLYIIGNMGVIANKSKTWRVVFEKLNAQEAWGYSLELECQVHGTLTEVKCERDFNNKAPEGGCDKPCDTELSCTHKCQRVCHVQDRQHKSYKCRLPCLKVCSNSKYLHPCKAECYEECPACVTRVEKTLNCEMRHKRILPCHINVNEIVCSEPVEKTLPCGHKEVLACHVRIHEYECKVKVSKQLPCGHYKVMGCYQDPSEIRCRQLTMKNLRCNHSQTEECWILSENVKCQSIVTKTFPKCGHKLEVKCCEASKQIPCRSNCTTRLACGHACVKVCHADDNPDHLGYECKKDCTKECEFGHKCKVKHHCYKPCPPCKTEIKRTLPNCRHETVLRCYMNPNQYECLAECERILPDPYCQHKCPNLCFQPCGPCMISVKKRALCGHGQTVPCSSPARRENCMELVSPVEIPSCGHKNGLVPCKFSHLPADEIVKHCNHPCGYEFKPTAGGCGHICKGDCSSCFQGRIHIKCQKKCGKQLVCGHVCDVPCSKVCPPCKKPCFMICEHSACKKNCGDPCTECKEKCTWSCPHIQCTKLCGEMCDRDPCNEPCLKTLKCGHYCVGYCGEPCPPLCRECDKEELTEVFLGNEDDEDARFVFLEDCGHVIESEGLENWLSLFQGTQISAKTCPKCKTTIRNCRRFANLIRQHYADVMAVKMKSFGNTANSNRMRDKWIHEITRDSVVEQVFPLTYDQVKSFLVNETSGAYGGMRLIPKIIDEFSMTSMDFIADSTKKAAHDIMNSRLSRKIISPYFERIVGFYGTTLSSMIKRQPLSRQEIRDFNTELDRLDYYKQLMIRRCLPTCNPENKRAYPIYLEAEKLLNSTLLFTTERKEYFKRVLTELDILLRSGLGVTDRERKEILQAMGMGQGHWFKCPNGHIYVIGECGGAMQESRCNECGAGIGGSSHRLRSDNQLAREMDGATHSAWPGGPGN